MILAVITVELPDELVDQVAQLRDCFPELLALSLHQPSLPAATHRYILCEQLQPTSFDEPLGLALSLSQHVDQIQ